MKKIQGKVKVGIIGSGGIAGAHVRAAVLEIILNAAKDARGWQQHAAHSPAK